MKILIFIIILKLSLNIPVKANSQNWDFIGQLGDNGGIVEQLRCHDSVNCYTAFQDHLNLYFYYSKDKSKTWEQRFKIFSDTLILRHGVYNTRGMSSPDTNHYFILFWEKFGIYKTKNGGYNWEYKEVDYSLEKNLGWHLEMYDSLFGIMATYYNFYYTYDGWETFIKVEPEYKFLPRMIKFIDKENLLVYGNDSINRYFANYSIKDNKFTKLYEMKPQSNGFRDGLQSMYSSNDKTIFCAGSRKHSVGDQSIDIIYKTTDGGKNWEKVLDSLHGYPYTPEGTTSAFGLQDISCYDENRCMAVGAYGKVVMTKDGGKTWVYEPEGEAPFIQDGADYDGPVVMHVAWAGNIPIIGTFDANFYRYKGDFFDFGTSVEETKEQSSLIYPNPSSDNISVDLGGVAVADLVIYDILGNEIMSFTNYTNKSEIDISTIPIGTYTIQIQTSTGSVSQRLLVNR